MDLQGDETMLITGATGGIGLSTAAALAGGGARVLVTGRNPDSAEAAVAQLKARSGNDRVDSSSPTCPPRPAFGRWPSRSPYAPTASTC